MSHLGPTRIRLGAQGTTLSVAGQEDVTVPAGVDSVAIAFFHHEPPTPAEMEQAIDSVEDALMTTGLSQAERGELLTSDAELRAMPGLRDPGASLTRDEIEAIFQRLASASLGDPSALRDLPAGGQAAAALLILRECMHHLGYQTVRVQPETAPAAPRG